MGEGFPTSRRGFLKLGLAAGVGAPLIRTGTALGSVEQSGTVPKSRIALTAGEDRADNLFRALEPFSDELSRAIGDRRIVLKPNNVLIDRQLAATHVDCLRGVIEALKRAGKTNIVIAESAANGSTLDGFENYSYTELARQTGVQLIDLDREAFEPVYVFDQTDFSPRAVRMSSILLDRKQNFVISVAKFKTHDRVVATLSLKNIVFGAPIKDLGFSWGPNRRAGSASDKHIAHGSGFRSINYNLFALAPRLHPDFAVIDGYRGMEGDGPNNGTPVEHRVALAGFDWLAADRVAIELMGIDFAKVGYLNYCARAGMGQGDLAGIEITGEKLKDHIRTYRLNRNLDEQLIWMKPANVS